MVLFSIHSSIDHGFTVFFGWLPHVLGFLAVLLIGYIVAKVLGSLVRRTTHRAGLDRTVHSQMGGSYVQRVIQSPSGLLGTIAFWAVWLSAISLAVSVLGVDALQNFVASIWAYLPNVLAAILIFLVAGAIAGGVVALVNRTMSDTALGRIVITYAALIGALALGSALAFGLGGREVAAEMVRGAYEQGQANKEQFARDAAMGKERAHAEVEQKRDELNANSSGDTARVSR
jgi:hypothetical protein